MKCCRTNCDIDNTSILDVIDDGEQKYIFCPTHTIEFILWKKGHILTPETITKASVQKELEKCTLCEEEAYEYFSPRSQNTFHLCKNHFVSLVTRNLSPEDCIELRGIYGTEEFHLEAEFYDEDGNSLQPIPINDFKQPAT